jgi:ethylbenzene dioxygenase beta subunit
MQQAASLAALGLAHEIQQFLYREARLLDEERYEEWLDLLEPDVRYVIPGVQARYRRDPAGAVAATRMAFFDDDLDYLRKRVARARQETAWAEDPPTRHFHLVANVEVEAADAPEAWRVRSLVVNVRHRNEDEEAWLTARREDLIRRVDGALKLAHRTVRLQQTVLQAKNLNTFL